MSRLGLAPFSIDGDLYTPHELNKALLPLLTASRMNKLNQVAGRRCWCIQPVLENIYDRGNVNAVMRSAEAFGFINFNIIHQPGSKVKESNRITQGTDKWLCTQQYSSTSEFIETARNNKTKIFVTDLETTKSIDDMDFSGSAAIVFGNEKDGVSEELKAAADDAFVVPMQGFAQSFNISVAAALTFQRIFYRRQNIFGHNGDLTDNERQELLAHYALQSLGQTQTALDKIKQAVEKEPANTLGDSLNLV